MRPDLLAWPASDDYVLALGRSSAEFGAAELRDAWLALEGPDRPRCHRWPGAVGFDVSAEKELVVVCFTSADLSERCRDAAGNGLRWHDHGILMDSRWMPIAVHDLVGFDHEAPVWDTPQKPGDTADHAGETLFTTFEDLSIDDVVVANPPDKGRWMVPAVAVMVALAVVGLLFVWLA